MMILGMKVLYTDLHFILGDCPTGLDKIARDICEEFCISNEVYTADWGIGKGAGPERNARMVAAKPDVAFAYREEGRSPGTDNCIEQARHSGIPCYTIRPLAPQIGMTVDGIKGYKYNSEVEGL